jgi:8-oxo-dGTP diphosphatase
MPPNPNVHAAVAGIVQRDHHILLLQRGSRAYYADGYGKWALPGGWLEHNENPYYAAQREVEEETGLVVRPKRDDGFYTHFSDDGKRHIVVLFVICEYLGGEPVNAEPEKALDVRWMNTDNFVELDLFAALDYWFFRRPKA